MKFVKFPIPNDIVKMHLVISFFFVQSKACYLCLLQDLFGKWCMKTFSMDQNVFITRAVWWCNGRMYRPGGETVTDTMPPVLAEKPFTVESAFMSVNYPVYPAEAYIIVTQFMKMFLVNDAKGFPSLATAELMWNSIFYNNMPLDILTRVYASAQPLMYTQRICLRVGLST